MLQRATNHVAHIGYFVALFISTYSIPALPLDLNNAQLVTRTTPVTWDEHIEYYLSTGFPGVTYAYFTFDAASEIYITLNDKNELSKLRASRESDKNFKFTYDVLKKWPLTRWPHLYYPEDLYSRHLMVKTPETIGEPDYYPYYKSAGCLSQAPLRYGTLYEGGEKEIVLILNDQLIVFSPNYERIIFATYLSRVDWLGMTASQGFVEQHGNDGKAYQHISEFMTGMRNPVVRPGIRSYAKLYTGDFDEDNNPDILVWRKEYISNLIDNPVKGFNLLRSGWVHYERNLEAQEQSAQGITGEYLPQSTTQDTIRQWLADKQLTWKTGYPSTSECAGEEGQLIPEMHDPLLNDPEVLQ